MKAMSSVLAVSLALSAFPAMAADRVLILTDFNRVRIEGSFIVEITTGRGSGGRISGTPDAIQGARVTVQGQTLIIRRSTSAWGGYPGRDPGAATIRLTVPTLSAAWVSGPAVVTIDRMRGSRLTVSLEGSGKVSVGAIEADRLDIGASGSGKITIAGRAADVEAAIRGSGDLDARALDASDLKLTSETAGIVTIAALRTASVIANGSGTVTIVGTPACTVTRLGAAIVMCGR